MTGISCILIIAVAGALLGGLLFIVPGLSLFMLAGVILTLSSAFPRLFPSPLAAAAFLLSLTVSYSFINTVPAMFFGAPDRSTLFLVNPGRRYRSEGRGVEGSMTVGVGSLIGVLLIAAGTPFYLSYLWRLREGLMFRYQWLVGALIVYMLVEEFVYHLRRARREGLRAEYRAMAAAPLIFLAIGLFGVLTTFNRRFILDPGVALVSPIVAGLILIPHLLWGVCRFVEPSPPPEPVDRDLGRGGFLGGAAAGWIGGIFAMLVPAMNAGPGVFLANQLSPRGDRRAFLVSQGISKMLSHVGAFFLFFIPYFVMVRGKMASLLRCYYMSYEKRDYFTALAVMLISAGVSFFMLGLASRIARWVVRTNDRRRLGAWFIILVVVMVAAFSGWAGLWYMLIATAVGSLPFFYSCNRSNVYAFILVPAMLTFSGQWGRVLALLGLV